jgi:hypothetical protein
VRLRTVKTNSMARDRGKRTSSAVAARRADRSSLTPIANTARPISSAGTSRNQTSTVSYRTSPRMAADSIPVKPSFSPSSVPARGSPRSVARASEDNPSTMPLFKLAQLTKKEQRVNLKKLTSFLEKHGNNSYNFLHFRSRQRKCSLQGNTLLSTAP